MVVEITLLGPPQVSRSGQPVVFETRKAMALLAHLVLHDRPRSRAALCELLYPGHAPDRTRAALRRTLSTLRTGIGEEWIEAAADGVALRRGPGLRVDVDQFRTLAQPASSGQQLRDAVELFSGDFLEGFALRGSPDFDDWHAETAEALKVELSSVLRRLVRHLVGRNELDQALLSARRWLAIDPLHEPAHRQLIRLHAWSGDRGAALEQYRTCVRTLSQELGVAPLEETAALYAQVSEGTLPRPQRMIAARTVAPTASARVAASPADLMLVGRTEELAALDSAYAAARPDGAVVVVEGEAGIGKTSLVADLISRARDGGAVVLEARCHDDETGLPYGPVVELLREAVGHTATLRWHEDVAPQRLADAALLVPELGDLVATGAAVLPLGGPGAQVRLVEGVAAIIGAACSQSVAGVVFIDDVHAADDASLDAIAYLGRRLAGRSLLLVLAWRSERVPPGHRLRRLVGELSRLDRATTVSPRRLGEDDVRRLVRSVVRNGSTSELERDVFLETEGLPLFVSEYLARVGETADGQRAAGSSLQAQGLLDGRLGGLGQGARQVLDAAAALGRSFDPDLLRRASGRSDQETVGALEELVARGLIREEGAGYGFSHQKMRVLVYERTAMARRQLLHGRIAAALTGSHSVGTGGGPAALVAQHLRLAGDNVGAAEYYRLAAEHAASLYAHTEALENMQAALALGHTDVAAVHERIGDLLTLLGDYGAARASYEAAAAYAEAPVARAGIEHKLGAIHQRRGEWGRAETCLLAALEAAPHEALGLRARVQADLGLTVLQVGEPARASSLARRALELAEAADDHLAQAQAHNMLGVIARSQGAPDRAREHLGRSLQLARDLGDAPAEAAALNNLALVLRDAGSLLAAIELTTGALVLCARYADRHREAALENNLADLHHAVGDEEASMVHLKRAVTLFREVGADEAARMPEIWKLVSW